MKFSGRIEDGTSNEPLNFGSGPWPWRRFALSECTLQAKICALRVLLDIIVIIIIIIGLYHYCFRCGGGDYLCQNEVLRRLCFR